MRTMVLAIILAFSASIVPALGGHGSKSSNAFIARVGSTHVHDHRTHQSARNLKAHSAFRYRKGGRCHHYHYLSRFSLIVRKLARSPNCTPTLRVNSISDGFWLILRSCLANRVIVLVVGAEE